MSDLKTKVDIAAIVKDINLSGTTGLSEWSAEDCAADHAIELIYSSGRVVCHEEAVAALDGLRDKGALFDIDVAVEKLLSMPFMS